MSKYQIQDLIEEDGRKVLDNALDTNYFLLNDFAKTSGKDKYPDIDGQIRLRDGNGKYLNMYLHYQLKSHQHITNPEKYYCSRKILNYLVDTNVPTIFFVVDVTNHKAYWIFLDTQITKILNLAPDNKGRSFDLIPNEISNSYELNAKCQKYAKEDNYEKVINELDKITGKFELNTKSFLGLLFLLVKVEKKRLPKIFSPLLNIEDVESQTIINYLEDHQVISKTVNYFLLENEQLGIESLYNLINSGLLDFYKLYDVLEQGDKKIVLKQLSKIKHINVEKHLKSRIKDLKDNLPKFKTNDDILVHLELLENYIHRIPNSALNIIKAIINNQTPLKPKVRTVKGWGKIEGKKHVDLVIECIALLDRIRYIKPKEVFTLLIKLSTYSDQKIQSEANKILKWFAEYNLFALKSVGYKYQLILLNEIEKWGRRELINLFDIVIMITRQLLSPTFEGHEMQDYKTMALHSGTLQINKELKNIRERTIEILKKLYLYTKELTQKENAIYALREAAQEPISSGYGNDMECMVQGNTNVLIDYYISIIPKADNEIIKIIEENIRFIHRHREWKLPRVKELLKIIESNKAYEMFRIFVGYDYRFSEDLDRNKAEDDRETKIQEFIKDISDENYKIWEGKILSVIKNYHKSGDRGEYMYFETFLNELSKQKPEVAYKLITNNEIELEPFLIHLLGGIWESSLKDHARSLISKWADKGKHICVCTRVFEYVKDVDEPLIDKIIKKAKKSKSTDALIYIIRLIDRRYPKNRNTANLFVSIVKELTKHSNYKWIDCVWHNKDSVLKLLTKTDYVVILDNLLLVPNFNSHVEGVLMPIAEKYPKQVIDFFYKRVPIQLKKRQKDRYYAIPFQLNKIRVPLDKSAKIVVPEILKWFSKKDRIFYSQACLVLHTIFPSFNNILKKELIRLVKTKSNKSAEIVIDILRQYEGEECLHNVCKELAKKYTKNDKYNMEIFHILSQMGVVSGAHGFAEGYIKKKELIQGWKKDKSKAIKSFVTKYEDYLDKQISYEQIRADESIVLRKRGFIN